MKCREFKWSLWLVLCIALCWSACSKDNEDESENPGGTEVVEPPFQPSAYALNIVYFLPTDLQPFEDYQRRLSEIMLWIQDFYRQNMIRNGFGNRTFGLDMETDKLVRIINISGKLTADGYPYEGGGTIATKEINAYFAAHPDEKRSEHVLVIMPNTKKNNMDPGGTPFYGLGKFCFAMDYRYFDIKYNGLTNDDGLLFTKWFGGLAHELGHGLNLPHNKERVSLQATLGTALMGAGNYTLGLYPTYMTEASCGILNNCQVFSPVEKDFYRDNNVAREKDISIKFEKEYIRINTVFQAESGVIVGAAVYFDNLPAGGAANEYDAESWYVKPVATDSFVLDIPWSELHFPKKDFAIRIRLLFTDGHNREFMYRFEYKNGVLEDYIQKY